MMYLIKKDGKFMLNGSDIKTIKEYGGNSARIVCSWDESEQSEALKDYFSKVKVDLSTLELFQVSGIKKFEMAKYIDSYYDDNIKVIELLKEVEATSDEELEEFSRMSEAAKKEQLELVDKCYKHKIM